MAAVLRTSELGNKLKIQNTNRTFRDDLVAIAHGIVVSQRIEITGQKRAVGRVVHTRGAVCMQRGHVER